MLDNIVYPLVMTYEGDEVCHLPVYCLYKDQSITNNTIIRRIMESYPNLNADISIISKNKAYVYNVSSGLYRPHRRGCEYRDASGKKLEIYGSY